MASSFNNLYSLLETITGSITIFFALYFLRAAPIVLISSLLESIPTFTLSTSISSKIAFICPSTMSVEIS